MAERLDFELSFELIIGSEGGYSDNRDDPGNWTGGAVGKGELKGTKYGISAASYPQLDIKNLTLEQAHEIYIRDYWTPACCPELPPRAAYVMFDSAVNNGVSRAARFLQTSVGATADGIIGPATRAALARKLQADPSGDEIAREVHAQRINFMAGLSTWSTFGLGWSRRLASVPIDACLTWPIALSPGQPPPETAGETEDVTIVVATPRDSPVVVSRSGGVTSSV
jgi:lysozyme family protein